MKVLAVFHDHGNHVLDRWLKPGFRHCFCAVRTENFWIRVDGQMGPPVIQVVAPGDYDLAGFYRAEGFTVVETEQRNHRAGLFVVANCVGIVKRVLAISAPFVVTPWQLYKKLTSQLLPGTSLFQPPAPEPEGWIWDPGPRADLPRGAGGSDDQIQYAYSDLYPDGKWIPDPKWIEKNTPEAPVPEVEEVVEPVVEEKRGKEDKRRRGAAAFMGTTNRPVRDPLGRVADFGG